MERVEKAIEGLVHMTETRVVEERLAQSNPKVRVEQTTIAKFYKQNPILYRGEADTTKIDFWIMDKERIVKNLS